MMVGDGEYGSHETMRAVRRDAADRLGATVNYCTPDVNEDGPDVTAHSYDGLDALADADLMVVYTRLRRLPDVQMKHLAGYLDAADRWSASERRLTRSTSPSVRRGRVGTSASASTCLGHPGSVTTVTAHGRA